jgi:hypothetical protein
LIIRPLVQTDLAAFRLIEAAQFVARIDVVASTTRGALRQAAEEEHRAASSHTAALHRVARLRLTLLHRRPEFIRQSRKAQVRPWVAAALFLGQRLRHSFARARILPESLLRPDVHADE